ncbi:MAG: hypothetical protein GY788_01370 [bacterium]|nr:hypothetical protein [bacterium]
MTMYFLSDSGGVYRRPTTPGQPGLDGVAYGNLALQGWFWNWDLRDAFSIGEGVCDFDQVAEAEARTAALGRARPLPWPGEVAHAERPPPHQLDKRAETSLTD